MEPILLPEPLLPSLMNILPLANFAGDWGMTLLASMAIPLIAVLVYPFLARTLLRLRSISDSQRLELQTNLPQMGSLVARRLLLWDTGNRICNAAVVGCIPGFSFVLISDALWQRLTPKSVAAIVAHELGHLRLWHVPMRLSIVFAGGMLGMALVQQAETFTTWPIAAQTVALLLTLGYMTGMLHLIAPLMEFQADAFAIDSLTRQNGNRRQSALTLVRALSQLTQLAGLRSNQATWLYPSFEQRRRVIFCLSTSIRLRRFLRLALAVVLASQWALMGGCLTILLAR